MDGQDSGMEKQQWASKKTNMCKPPPPLPSTGLGYFAGCYFWLSWRLRYHVNFFFFDAL